MHFVRFSELNEHEQEKHHYFIPVEGNETALALLRELIPDDWWKYELEIERLYEEHQVDFLVAEPVNVHQSNRYYKLCGEFSPPNDIDDLSNQGILNFVSLRH